MSERYQTIKILRETHRLLKILAAKTGESMLDLIERLARAEEERVRQGRDKDGNT
jgi:hypothetical protein